MPIDLYHTGGSPPCLIVVLGAKMAGVDLNLKNVALNKREHFKAEYLKMNPQHTVPTLDDNGLTIGESRAILCYLMDQYAKDDSLYPKDPKKRALVHQMLYFDAGTFYQRFYNYYFPPGFPNAPRNPKMTTKIEEAFEILEKFLEGQEWVAGSTITIADISVAVTVSLCTAMGFSVEKLQNVSKWFEKCRKTIPSFDDLSNQHNKIFVPYINRGAGK